MSGYLDQLNLRPHEKRILMVVIAVVFVLVNVFFVWPKFGAWDKTQAALAKSKKTLAGYEAEIARVPAHEAKLRELEGQGSTVLPEEQAVQLLRIVQTEAQRHNVPITSTRVTPPASGAASTNTFFDEQSVVIGVNAGEKELVDFLQALGTGREMIRVRDMDLRPDPPRYKLNGSITLVASYQKKPKVNAPARATTAPAPAATNAPPKTP